MSDLSDTLPRSVTRPLFGASAVVAAFIIMVVVWSVMAPLATTIHVSGTIVSAQPTLELQHPYGGEVTAVYIQKHARVRAGDILLRLDDRLDRAALQGLRTRRQRIQAENAAIDAFFADEDAFLSMPQSGAGAALQLKHQLTAGQHKTKSESARSLREQATVLDQKVTVARQQADLMRARLGRQDRLAQQGLVPKTEQEAEAERLLIIQGEVQSDLASLLALRDQARQTKAQADAAALALKVELAAKREANLSVLDELEPRIVELEDRISKAVILAPSDGTVTQMHFLGENMYVQRGASLVSLAQPLERPHVAFHIPPHQIDQVTPGMTGKLVIPSLPQRAMPNITVRVTAISPRANLDEAGQPISYEGRATFEGDALALVQDALADVSLSEDMPVSISLAARETTLASYLVSPFLAAFQNALQD
ncbi:HlyD family efflux transporter periplasmic adaptor subunit [Shimia ponticola]|uniref:HlyD family efflux transporter periplasmic adaptor subunit n=1 Tax=Shimia ponticola TaxID=2582893 RepID=UPI001C9B1716|nr:HlyD family efflux transporter periplasmic adaptor subunit [Shimia ponticola]